MSEWTEHRPQHTLWPQTPSLASRIFCAPVLTEEEIVTPHCKEKTRGGEVRTSVSCLYSTMSLGLRKGPWRGQAQTRITPKVLWSDCGPSATTDFSP